LHQILLIEKIKLKINIKLKKDLEFKEIKETQFLSQFLINQQLFKIKIFC